MPRQHDNVQWWMQRGFPLLERCACALLASIRLQLRTHARLQHVPRRYRVSILGAVAHQFNRCEQRTTRPPARSACRRTGLGHLVIRLRPCPGRAVSLLR